MRVRVVTICLTAAGLLAGCATKPLPQAQTVAPNPFGYLKRSAGCKPGPVTKTPEGQAVSIATRSDDGICGVTVSQPGDGAYASFLLTTLPLHGKGFIYNYNKQTYVNYTADPDYAGPDSFVASLVPGGGKPRTMLKVDLTVDNTGVAPPAPPPAAAPAKPAGKSATHRKTRHRVVHHHTSSGSKAAQ